MREITMGSLFDGIGGFPLAAVRNGVIPLWASEIEAFPIEVTKHHFPDMLHVGGISQNSVAQNCRPSIVQSIIRTGNGFAPVMVS